jgi:hypothetical protein
MHLAGHTMQQYAEHRQRNNLLSVIGGLAPAVWQIGSGGNLWRAIRRARRVGLGPRPQLDDRPGVGALTRINAMIPPGGKGVPLAPHPIEKVIEHARELHHR